MEASCCGGWAGESPPIITRIAKNDRIMGVRVYRGEDSGVSNRTHGRKLRAVAFGLIWIPENTMRSIAGALALMAVIGSTVSAQDFETKYKDKLKKDFVSKVEWVQSLEKAKESAAAQNKLIFGYFTRSYAP